MNYPIIIGGKIRQFHTERPSVEKMREHVERATANGITLAGVGPFRRVSGVLVPVVVGPSGCSCVLARHGEWCFHRSLYLAETGQVAPPKPAPAPIPMRPRRERRPWTRRPLWIVRPVTPIRPRTVA